MERTMHVINDVWHQNIVCECCEARLLIEDSDVHYGHISVSNVYHSCVFFVDCGRCSKSTRINNAEDNIPLDVREQAQRLFVEFLEKKAKAEARGKKKRDKKEAS
jgi:hypothetical protein